MNYISSRDQFQQNSRLPYGVLITLNMCSRGINIIDNFKSDMLVNVEIGKETLKLMILRLTPEGWANTRHNFVRIWHDDHEKAAEVLKERLKRCGKSIA